LKKIVDLFIIKIYKLENYIIILILLKNINKILLENINIMYLYSRWYNIVDNVLSTLLLFFTFITTLLVLLINLNYIEFSFSEVS